VGSDSKNAQNILSILSFLHNFSLDFPSVYLLL